MALLCLLLGSTAGPCVSVQAAPAQESVPFGRTVKEIRISGLKKTKRFVIVRELATKTGEPYTRENAEQDPKRLDQLGMFSQIDIHPTIEGEDVVLQITLRETSPLLPILSLDVSDENGLSIGPGFKALNLKGEAIRLSTSARFGGSTQVSTTIENPWFAGNHASYEFQFQYRDRPNGFEDFQEQSLELELDVGSYVQDNGRIGGRIGFLSLGSDIPGITLSPDNRDSIPTLALYLGYDSRNFWSDPTEGWWNEFEISKSGGIFGESDFWTLTFDIRRFQPLVDRHTIALFSLATYRTGAIGDEIPGYLNFHLGGTNTIRGWDLDSSQGKNQFINTAEYRYTLLKRRPLGFKGLTFYAGLQLALFADFGIAWDDSAEFRGDNFIDGYGFGIRILIPFVDMLRFEFAFGQPDRGLGSNIGILEKSVKQRERIR